MSTARLMMEFRKLNGDDALRMIAEMAQENPEFVLRFIVGEVPLPWAVPSTKGYDTNGQAIAGPTIYSIPHSAVKQIMSLLKEAKRVEAIKVLRSCVSEQGTLSLRDSKEIVDHWVEHPVRY